MKLDGDKLLVELNERILHTEKALENMHRNKNYSGALDFDCRLLECKSLKCRIESGDYTIKD